MQTVILGLIIMSAYVLIRLLAKFGAWMSGAISGLSATGRALQRAVRKPRPFRHAHGQL